VEVEPEADEDIKVVMREEWSSGCGAGRSGTGKIMFKLA
jgi:hypothetical protein